MKIYKNGISDSLSNDLYSFGFSYFFGDEKISEYGYPNKVITKTNYSWNNKIVEESKPVIIYLLPDELKNKVCEELKELGVLSGAEFGIGSMIYVWTEGSYIPAHKDKNEDSPNRIVCTIYLNPEWEISNGGTFNYKEIDSEEWKMIVPERGTVVFNDKPEVHYTTPVIGKIPRITLQFFAVKK